MRSCLMRSCLMHMHVWMCMGTRVCRCRCMCPGLMSDIFLDGSSRFYWSRVFLWNRSSPIPANPAGHRDSPSLLLLCWDYRRLQYLSSFYRSSSDLNFLLRLVQQVFYSLGHLPALKLLFLNKNKEMITIFLELPITRCCVKSYPQDKVNTVVLQWQER